jgi:hypothetical protein
LEHDVATTPRGKFYKGATVGEVFDIDLQLNNNLDKLDALLGAGVYTSGTRPPAPFDGQLIKETDTHRILAWNAALNDWTYVSGPLSQTAVHSAAYTAATAAAGGAAVDILAATTITLTSRGPVDIAIQALCQGVAAASNWAGNIIFAFEDTVGSGTYVTKATVRIANNSLATLIPGFAKVRLENVSPGAHRFKVQVTNDAGSATGIITSAFTGMYSVTFPG